MPQLRAAADYSSRPCHEDMRPRAHFTSTTAMQMPLFGRGADSGRRSRRLRRRISRRRQYFKHNTLGTRHAGARSGGADFCLLYGMPAGGG